MFMYKNMCKKNKCWKLIESAIYFVLFLSVGVLFSCERDRGLFVTFDFWWNVYNRDDILSDTVKRLNLNLELVSNIKELKEIFEKTETQNSTFGMYDIYIFDPVVSKWIVSSSNEDESFGNLIFKALEDRDKKWGFMLRTKNAELSRFENVVEIVLDEGEIFELGGRILSRLFNTDSKVRALQNKSCTVGILYYPIVGEDYEDGLKAFERGLAANSFSVDKRKIESLRNKVKAKSVFEDLMDSGVKIFMFDCYSLNPYLVDLADKSDVAYVIDYSQGLPLSGLIFSFDYDYTKIIEAVLMQINDRKDKEHRFVNGNLEKGVSDKENGKGSRIITKDKVIWWGKFTSIPEEFRSYVNIRNFEAK